MTSSVLPTKSAMKILIVEDSPTQGERLRYILQREGFAVTWARHGQEALELLPRWQPDLVISDIMMPQMNGFELCREIKNDPRWRQIPVILLTSLSSMEDVMHGLKCGADNFITKPYNDHLLLRRIEFILHNQDSGREAPSGASGIEIIFGGQKHYINSEPTQILSLLISTFESAVAKNQELEAANRELVKAKALLEKQAEELQALSLQDGLTGLYNRRGFMTLGEHQLRVAARNLTQITLMFIDLDNLKYINDTFGHAAGDQALVATAQLLQATFRQSDIIARLGGDEFAVLHICSSARCCETLQQRLEENLAAFNACSGQPFSLEFSIGFAFFDPEAPLSLEEMLTQADAAMYEVKKAKKAQGQAGAGLAGDSPAQMAGHLRLV